MTDDDNRAELAREMDAAELRERLVDRARWFAAGLKAGLMQALEDAADSSSREQIIETLAARLAPTVGRDQ